LVTGSFGGSKVKMQIFMKKQIPILSNLHTRTAPL
jgi:hypothetical protein